MEIILVSIVLEGTILFTICSRAEKNANVTIIIMGVGKIPKGFLLFYSTHSLKTIKKNLKCKLTVHDDLLCLLKCNSL